MEHAQICTITQGNDAVTVPKETTPVIPLGAFTTVTAAAMVVNFLRTGAPSVQCLGEEYANPLSLDDLVFTVNALALPGEHLYAECRTNLASKKQELIVFVRTTD